MQAGAPYVPPDCQTYPGGQKESSPRIFLNKYHSLPLYLS